MPSFLPLIESAGNRRRVNPGAAQSRAKFFSEQSLSRAKSSSEESKILRPDFIFEIQNHQEKKWKKSL